MTCVSGEGRTWNPPSTRSWRARTDMARWQNRVAGGLVASDFQSLSTFKTSQDHARTMQHRAETNMVQCRRFSEWECSKAPCGTYGSRVRQPTNCKLGAIRVSMCTSPLWPASIASEHPRLVVMISVKVSLCSSDVLPCNLCPPHSILVWSLSCFQDGAPIHHQ